MRRFLYILGALSLIVIVANVVSLGVAIFNAGNLDAESKAYVDSAVPAIVANWNEHELLDRATPELRKSITPAALDDLFNRLSHLGAMVEYDGATGQATMSYFTGAGSTVSASYVAKARFQNGTATFEIVLMKRGGHWMIHNFHVDAVGNPPVGQRT